MGNPVQDQAAHAQEPPQHGVVGSEGTDLAGDDTSPLAFPPFYQELNTQLPDLAFNLTSRNVQAKSRKLKSMVSIGPTQDLRTAWGQNFRREPDVIDRLAALTWSAHRDVIEILAKLPEDLIDPDVKDMAMGNILRLIPEKYWGSSWSRDYQVFGWEESAMGMIADVIKKRGLDVAS
jgi:hypothetical protein